MTISVDLTISTSSSLATPKVGATTVSTASTPKVMAIKNRNHSKDFRPGMRLRKEKKMKRRM